MQALSIVALLCKLDKRTGGVGTGTKYEDKRGLHISIHIDHIHSCRWGLYEELAHLLDDIVLESEEKLLRSEGLKYVELGEVVKLLSPLKRERSGVRLSAYSPLLPSRPLLDYRVSETTIDFWIIEIHVVDKIPRERDDDLGIRVLRPLLKLLRCYGSGSSQK